MRMSLSLSFESFGSGRLAGALYGATSQSNPRASEKVREI
jgi:hypothetical protein